MRITNNRLRQIIQEELGSISEQMDLVRADPSVIAQQHSQGHVTSEPGALGDIMGDVADMAVHVMNDFANAIIENPDTMNALSLGTKVVGGALTLFPEPATTAAGLTILKGSAVFDVGAAAGYASEEDYYGAWFSALSAGLWANPGNAMQFYRQATRLRNALGRLRGNPGVLYLLKKTAPAWGYAGASGAIESILQSAEHLLIPGGALAGTPDTAPPVRLCDDEGADPDCDIDDTIQGLEDFISDTRDLQEFFESLEEADSL